MDKKKIISTTLMFIVVVGSVVLFKSVFGDKNILVGIAGITAALSLLGTDYSLNPIRNTIYFIILEIGLGLAAFITSLNPLLALVTTFVTIFYILYVFTYNTKKPTYVAFTLGYCFMVYTPVTIQEMPLRLLGLAFCGLAIMILQIVVNKNRLKKQTVSQIAVAVNSISKEVSLILAKASNKDRKELNFTTHKNLKNLNETLYEVIDKNYSKLSHSLIQNFFIAQFLESLNIELNKLNKDTGVDKTQHFCKILDLLMSIENFIGNKENLDYLLHSIDKYLEVKDFSTSNNYVEYKIYTHASILKIELENTKTQDVSEIVDHHFTTNLITSLDRFKNNINKNSLKFTFAFRGALVISLGIFIVSAFKIENGKWLVFSLISIVQPYLDTSKAKGNERILGTLIGIVIFEVVFFIVTDTTARTMIILLVGYLNNYQKNYRNQMICTTISALGSASIGLSISILGVERLTFVLLGTVIALYANKLILPYKASDAVKSSIKQLIGLNKKIISIVYKKGIWSSTSNYDLEALISINKLLTKLIDSNNNMLTSKEVDDFIYNQHEFVNDIRILANLFEYYEKNRSKKLRLSYHIDYLNNKELSNDEILDYINNLDDNLAQLILVNLISIKENLAISKKISNSAIKSI
ncbi:FUSC family protein [Romboutsia sp.]|uniref:FUSC family protein n=1 Tax=Romboutsia sp. TaxID=1965302 RepID=UPI003F36D6B0